MARLTQRGAPRSCNAAVNAAVLRAIRIPSVVMAVMVAMVAALVASTPAMAAEVAGSGQSFSFYVDRTVPGCSDTGPGDATTPFCTVAKGVSQLSAGSSLAIGNGTYAETIIPKVSGTASAPILIAGWPGRSPVVGSGAINGAWISGRSYITISNLTVTGTSGDGIYVTNSSNITVSGNIVTKAGQPAQHLVAPGISLRSSTASVITNNIADDNSDTGIFLTSGTTGSTVSYNEASHNAQVWQRNANGINVVSPGNTIIGNVTHDNEDSGVQFYPGGNNNLATLNVTYNNGDHGIDDYGVTGGRLIGNTVYHNCTTGINLEGATAGSYTIENNIAVDNAVYPAYKNISCSRRAGNIGVWDGAPPTTTVDHNLVWLTKSGTMYVFGSSYTSLAAMQKATGQESDGVQADPRFVAAASGNLQLTEGSPAIDRADSGVSGEQGSDILGNPRVRDPNVSNTFAAGPRLYDDLGAYELQPATALAPSAALTVTPMAGTAPLAVTADASGSSDPQGRPLSYAFDFGDGTPAATQTTPTVTHTYAGAGSYVVKVTVTNASGLSASAQQTVTATAPVQQPPKAALTVTPTSGTAPLSVTADASASSDPQGQSLTYAFDFGDGTTAAAQPTPTITHTYAAGSYLLVVTVTDGAGLSSTAQQNVTVTAQPAQAPTVALSVTPTSGTAPLSVTADASGSADPQGQTLSYAFVFGDGSTAAAQASPSITHSYTAAGTYQLQVTVTNTSGLSSTAQQTVTVTAQTAQAPTAALTVTPTGGTAPLAVTADASGSSDPQGQALSYAFDFGDGSTAPAQPGATITHTYTAAGTFTLKVVVSNASGLSDTAVQTVTAVAAPSAAPSYIGQIATNYSTGSKTSGSVTVWRSAGVRAGDLVVLSLQLSGTTATGPVTGTDAAGNTYSVASDVANASGGRLLVLYALAVKPLAVNDRIAVTFPAAAGGYRMIGDELADVTQVDAVAAAPGTGSAFSSGPSPATTVSQELALGTVALYGATGDPAWDSGWRNMGSYTTGSARLGRAYQLPTATGVFTASGTGSGSWLAAVVTFRP